MEDALGNPVRLLRPAKRVISLAPHITENLFAAGAGRTLVGATLHCDHPQAARSIPRVGDASGLDLETIVSLAPDLILAWKGGNRQSEIDSLRALGFVIYFSNPQLPSDIPREIEALGQLTGSEANARRVAQRLRGRLASLRQRYASQNPVDVFYEIWHQPLMTVSGKQIISRAIHLCGGRNPFAHLPAQAATVNLEAVLTANPDVIITSQGPERDTRWRERWHRWPRLHAVSRDNLYFVPADLLQRPGPRFLDGLERLCALIHQARKKANRRTGKTAGTGSNGSTVGETR